MCLCVDMLHQVPCFKGNKDPAAGVFVFIRQYKFLAFLLLTIDHLLPLFIFQELKGQMKSFTIQFSAMNVYGVPTQCPELVEVTDKQQGRKQKSLSRGT